MNQELNIKLNLTIDTENNYEDYTFLETYLKRKIWDLGPVCSLSKEDWNQKKFELGMELAKQELENLEMKDELYSKSNQLFYSILFNAIAFGILTFIFM